MDGGTRDGEQEEREDTSPRDPQRGALHAILRDHLPTFLDEREEAGAPLPKFVVKELRGYLTCGVLANGCAHFRCEKCGLDRVTALSCKGRGICPRCCGRRMTETAQHLTERVLPHERIRQWVLSFPFWLRPRLAFHHDLTLELARITTAEIDRRYRRLARAAGLTTPRGGSVTAMQRFGDGARLNLHFHALALDGAYGKDASGREQFFTAPAPSPKEVEQILKRIVKRAAKLLGRSGDDDDIDDSDRSLAQAYSAAATAHGTEKHAPEERDEQDGQVILPTRRKARIEGFDLDAEVAVRAHDRERLEHLCRYILRPPIALNRLRYVPPALVVIELKKPWLDRTTHVSMTPSAFIARLASLVPRPRKNTLLYFGVLAGNARGRRELVPKPTRNATRQQDSSWAALMKHSFGIDPLSCRSCKGRMALVAVIHDRKEVRRLLQNLRIWSDPLPVHPARGPPDDVDSFDFP